MAVRFWLRLGLLAAPFLALLGLPFLVLAVSGEMLPVGALVRLQRAPGAALVGLAYTNPAENLKLRMTLARRPRVLALGSSRVMQIRDSFFAAPDDFYNAGGGVTALPDFGVFLAHLPRDRQPDLLLLGVDQYFFNAAWRGGDTDYAAEVAGDRRDGLGTLLRRWPEVYQDFAAGRFGLADLMPRLAGPRRIGVTALVHRAGFRRDGSYDYGDTVSPDLDVRFADARRRIAQRSERFAPARAPSPERLAMLDRLLDDCRARGLHVVGFLPPYPHTILALMRAAGTDYAYLDALGPALGAIFARHGYAFADYSDLAALGANDGETIDGFHASEGAYRRLVADLARRDHLLGALVAPELSAPPARF